MKRNKTEASSLPATQERSRRRADNETRYDELLDRAMRRREYEKRFGRGND